MYAGKIGFTQNLGWDMGNKSPIQDSQYDEQANLLIYCCNYYSCVFFVSSRLMEARWGGKVDIMMMTLNVEQVLNYNRDSY